MRLCQKQKTWNSSLLGQKTINEATLKLLMEILQSVSMEEMSLDHSNVVARCKELEDFRRTQQPIIEIKSIYSSFTKQQLCHQVIPPTLVSNLWRWKKNGEKIFRFKKN